MFIVSAFPPMSWEGLHICKISKRKGNCAAQAGLQKLQQIPEPQGIRKKRKEKEELDLYEDEALQKHIY